MKGHDRLSDLPEPLLHHIFSFIPTKELIRSTSLLSKNWRDFWVSFPHLFFDIADDDVDRAQDHDNRFVCSPSTADRLLRDTGPSDLQSFRLEWQNCCKGSPVKYWIGEALNRNVQELDICLQLDRVVFTVPARVFAAASSVKAIRLEACICCYRFLVPRQVVLAHNLRTLELIGIKLPRGDSEGELVFSCPVLETLIMDKCWYKHLKVVNLSVNRLRKLEIDNKGELLNRDPPLGDCKLELHTPNLSSFAYKGVMFSDLSIGKLAALIDVDLSLWLPSKSDDSKYMKLFESLNSARTLTLKTLIFSEGPKPTRPLISELLTSYANLKKLELITFIVNGTCLSSLGLPLYRCCSIETLVLCIVEYYGRRRKEELTLPSCPLNHLKYIVVWGLEGHDDELELLKFLFTSAVNLERMAITGSRSKKSENETSDLLNFQDKLMALSQDFPNVEVSFQIL